MVEYIDNKYVYGKMPKRPEESNKGTFGKILNIAGSKNYTGAAYLSTISALKIGAGYITLACPDIIAPIMAAKMSEPTFIYLKSTADGAISSDNSIKGMQEYNVISLGDALANPTRFDDQFTLKAFATYEAQDYFSTNTKTSSDPKQEVIS